MIIRKQIGELFRWHVAFTRRNKAAGTILTLLVLIACVAGFVYMADQMVTHRPCGPSCHH